MSQTGNYITVDEVLFNSAGFSGDTTFTYCPYGFYVQQISDAFEELNMATMMMDGHADFDMPTEHLTIPLPADCFNVRNIWVYSGDICDIGVSKKVWHKRNYYTQGKGYLANRTGYNTSDPYYLDGFSGGVRMHENLDLIRYNNPATINNVLFFNIQNGNLMLSASCKAAGTKVHIHYASTGCKVGDAPIIPRFYKKAIEDYTTEAALRFRMANEPSNAKFLMALQQEYKMRMDKNGFYGSWHDAVVMARKMSKAEAESLSVYLGKGAWSTGR